MTNHAAVFADDKGATITKAICGHSVWAHVGGRIARRNDRTKRFEPIPGSAYLRLVCLQEPGHDGDHRADTVWSGRSPSAG